MPSQHTVTASYVDTCLPCYLTDHTGILVGAYLGQSLDDTITELADEACSDDDFPLGDHAHALLVAAIRGALAGVDLRACDANGNRTDDEDTDDEQPLVWVRVAVESKPLRIKLDNQGSDHEQDGMVLVTCDDRAAAADDGYIDGSSWETPRDLDEAYTRITDRPSLVAELEAEGYDVDTSCYSAPEPEDMARWASWDGCYR